MNTIKYCKAKNCPKIVCCAKSREIDKNCWTVMHTAEAFSIFVKALRNLKFISEISVKK